MLEYLNYELNFVLIKPLWIFWKEFGKREFSKTCYGIKINQKL